MITTSIRLQCESREDAEQIKAWLEAALGDAVHLTAPHAGRGQGVWFVRGTLQVEPQRPAQPRPKTTTPEEIDRQLGNAMRLVDAALSPDDHAATGETIRLEPPAAARRPRRKH